MPRLPKKSGGEERRLSQATLFPDSVPKLKERDSTLLNRPRLLEALKEIAESDDVTKVRHNATKIKNILLMLEADSVGIRMNAPDSERVSLRLDVLVGELDQIIEAHTLERARHYVTRLLKGVQEPKTGGINDINLNRWKEYEEVITDSLWFFDRRERSGAHLAWYWGNFVPQIPHQLLLRYTKAGDWVLDTFVGSGTTLIECRRLGRNGIGIELNQRVAEEARKFVALESDTHGTHAEVIVGDSGSVDIEAELAQNGIKKIQLLIMHPPYHDIIRFSEDPRDLSNAKSVDDFLKMFADVVANAAPYLESGRYFGLVIGDKYAGGVWIPLGFMCMNEVLKRGDFDLRSIIVKNFDETKGKRNQKELWRYRALVGGFYVFKHEYVFLFQKRS